MSGVSVGTVAAVIGATAAVAGAGVAYKNGQEQNQLAKQNAAQSKTAADQLYNQQEQATNKANAKMPNTDAMFAQNQIAGQQGPSSTMLTGPMGVDPSSLSLGKNSLVGGA